MRYLEHQYDFVVAGGGISGVAAAVTAARLGLKTALVQDRPVLGGVGSKEIQVPMVGAHSIDGNYAYGRETGLMEELLLENLYRNPTRTPEYWDLTLTDLVKKEPDLDVYLNTSIVEVQMNAEGTRIESVKGYTIGAETWHTFHAPLFSDCTGDATVGCLAGAPFRTGAESRAEFGESLAPEEAVATGMGSSMQFRAKDAGVAVPFVKPQWVSFTFNEEDFGPYRPIQSFRRDHGGYWWIEWGALYDPVHDTNRIKDELLQVVYAMWDYLKNRSSMKDYLSTFVLDWVGTVPGKRESRRLIGEHLLTQVDLDSGIVFPDAVAYGGWGYDDHPSTGIFGEKPTTYHVFHDAPYNVPLRCLYSVKVENLFFAGRNISASHVALSTTRVMLTCGQLGEAVGAAAAMCSRDGCLPKQLLPAGKLAGLQQQLLERDHYIAGVPYAAAANVAGQAQVTASSELVLGEWMDSAGVKRLDNDLLQMFPVVTERLETLTLLLDASEATELAYEVYGRAKGDGNVPAEDSLLTSGRLALDAGERLLAEIPVAAAAGQAGWHFLVLKRNPAVCAHYAGSAPVGVKDMYGLPPHEIHANRNWMFNRSLGSPYQTLCFAVSPAQPAYEAANAVGGWDRPVGLPCLWSSQPTDFAVPEWLELAWEQARPVQEVQLLFDSSLDINLNPIAYAGTAQESDPRHTIPALVRHYRLLGRASADEPWRVLAEERNNYRRNRLHRLEDGPAAIGQLRLEVLGTHGLNRAQVYSVRVR
ncbi:FAD-dependent oxidoreductase [Paenibacillus thalictri]|uniref:FAD-dependent oxidoreductase n=1 Tax=Paenibacillus thalictri TaxID=2527873 RepID=A0A4V2J3P9_9BACL|nr:FAD-dependent oxidoreductase [Paenibacillus thalictri]TBL74662.1 FAD-dependent oxidoreductase [Paenibacillus thalictri]